MQTLRASFHALVDLGNDSDFSGGAGTKGDRPLKMWADMEVCRRRTLRIYQVNYTDITLLEVM